MENFFVVQIVKLRKCAAIADSRTNTGLSASSTVKPHGSMTALRSMRHDFLAKQHTAKVYIARATERRVAEGCAALAMCVASGEILCAIAQQESGYPVLHYAAPHAARRNRKNISPK